MTSSPRSEAHLRPEARPVAWDVFSQAQQLAFAKLVRMIDDATGRLQPPQGWRAATSHDPMEWLKVARSNQVAFLTGGRGTGKSTVMSSLMDATLLRSKAHDAQPCENESIPPPLRERLRRMRTRMVWLETIDMEPAPQKMNMLAAIMARVERACYRVGSVGAQQPDSSHGLLDQTPAFRNVLRDLQMVQNDIALAWDGNLPDRSAHLDSDAYAVEVTRTELTRLRLLGQLTNLLDALAAEAFHGTEVSNPLFVLPIDDFDLNPAASLQLLRLLRMIYSPRLFTIVLGDPHIIDIVLNLNLSSELASVSRHARGTLMLSVPEREVAAVAGQVAAHAMRKLLPPGQRIPLGDMTLAEGLNFRPLGYTDATPRLHELLHACPMIVGYHVLPKSDRPQRVAGAGLDTMRDFLLMQRLEIVPEDESMGATSAESKPQSAASTRSAPDRDRQHSGGKVDGQLLLQDLTEGHLRDCCYSGRLFLDAPPRRLADIWFQLNEFIELLPPAPDEADGEKPVRTADDMWRNWKRGIDLLAGLCRNVLLEEPTFSAEARRSVQKALTEKPHGDYEWNDLPVDVSSVTGRDYRFEVEARTPPDVELYRVRAVVRRGHEWRFRTMNIFQQGETAAAAGHGTEPSQCLSSEAAASLTLLHDMLVLGPAGPRFTSPWIVPRQRHWEWAATRWENRADVTVELPWPMPPCFSFWGLDLFRSAWSSAVWRSQIPRSDARAVDALAFAWISAGCAIIDLERPVQTDQRATSDQDWERLKQRLDGLVDHVQNKGLRHEEGFFWLTDVATMLMPESGYLAAQLIDRQSRLMGFWRAQQTLIQRQRAGRLAQLQLGGMPEAAVRKLRDAHPREMSAWCPTAAMVREAWERLKLREGPGGPSRP